MLQFFVDNFSSFWAVFFVSSLPMFESRVAIPLGLSVQIWGTEALSPFVCFLIAYLSSFLPAFVVIFLAKALKKKTSGFVFDKFIVKVQNHYKEDFERIGKKNTALKKCMAAALFVAVPLPLTGVYSGSLIAGFSNLKWWQGFLSVMAGQFVSCGIVLLLSTLFENSAFYVLLFSILLIVVFAGANLLLRAFQRIKKEKR